jgi:phosphoribosylformylglycinamidine synthase
MGDRAKVLVLHASGTNRDREAAWACELAGGRPEIVHVNRLRAGERRLADYGMLVIPGGFSYGDALGAGKLLSLDLRLYFEQELAAFVAAGRPVIGICNGFQALVKSGILPGGSALPATLTFNASGHFECRWVTLLPDPHSPCIFTRGLSEPIDCPVAHGEGRFVSPEAAELAARGQAALRYAHGDATPAAGAYPSNPNGSIGDIAGLCNPAGNVLGLMPHPEDHIVAQQHPRWTRGAAGRLGLTLFAAGVRYAG